MAGGIRPQTLARRDELLQERFFKAFLQTKTMTGACKMIGIDPKVVDRWRDNNVLNYEQKFLDANTNLNDIVKSILWKHIISGNLGAAIFWLKYKDPEFKARFEFSGGFTFKKAVLDEREKAELERIMKLSQGEVLKEIEGAKDAKGAKQAHIGN